MTIKDMIEKRAKAWETAKNFVDTHENENGVLSAEDNATYSRMEQEIEDLTAAIDRQQRAEAREAALNQLSTLRLPEDRQSRWRKRPDVLPMPTRKTSVRISVVRDLFTTSFPRVCRLMAATLCQKSSSVRSWTGLDEANVVRGLARSSLPAPRERSRLRLPTLPHSGQLRTVLIPRAVLPSTRRPLMPSSLLIL